MHVRSSTDSAVHGFRRDVDLTLRILRLGLDAVIGLDTRLTVVFFNQGAERLFQVPHDTILGQPIAQLIPALGHPTCRHRIDAFRARSYDDGSCWLQAGQELWGKRPSGEGFPIEASVSRVCYAGEDTLTLVVREISPAISLERRLHGPAFRDRRTGLLNRDGFHERLHQTLDRASAAASLVGVCVVRTPPSQTPVGTDTGSPAHWTLHEDPPQLARLIRSIEAAVGPCESIARLDWDLLAFLIHGLDHDALIEPTRQVISALLKHLQREAHPDEADEPVGLGLAVFPRDGEDSQRLIERAEASMDPKPSVAGPPPA